MSTAAARLRRIAADAAKLKPVPPIPPGATCDERTSSWSVLAERTASALLCMQSALPIIADCIDRHEAQIQTLDHSLRGLHQDISGLLQETRELKTCVMTLIALVKV